MRTHAPAQDIAWASVVVDEAHRMKSSGSATRGVLAALSLDWLLLLTGATGSGLWMGRDGD